MVLSLVLAALASLCLAASSNLEYRRASIAAPDGVEITSISTIGTGCAPGTLNVAFNGDKSALIVFSSQLNVSVGPQVLIAHNRRACQMTVGISVPDGYTYGLTSLEVAGQFELEKGITGYIEALNYYSNQNVQTSVRVDLVGPLTGHHVFKESFWDVNWGSCNGRYPLNVHTSTRLSDANNTSASGTISAVGFIQTYHLIWQTCRI